MSHTLVHNMSACRFTYYCVLLNQVFKWVEVNGTRFQAWHDRHDCVKLTHEMTSQNAIFQYARILWIIRGVTSEPICLAVPLISASRSVCKAQTEGQKAVVACFPTITRIPNRLVCIPSNLLSSVEQVQFVPTRNCELGLVNIFYQSNIIHAT